MGAVVGEFELLVPKAIWGVDGYTRAAVLFRHGSVPIGWLILPTRHASVLTADQLRQTAEESDVIHFTEHADVAMHSNPFISVIVCTRDRPLSLRRCLESLKSLRYDNYEVLVVDNASRSDETKDVVAETPFRYLREQRPGLDWARNCGLRAATGDIVAYTDDDVRVDANWLNGIAHGFRDPEVSCVTGLICPLELQTDAQVLFEDNGGMNKGLWPKVFDPAKLKAKELIAAHFCGVGANMAFRRRVLLDLEGFDVHLDVGTPSHGGGDLDIFHRTLHAGKIIRYEPNALVWHQHRRSMPALHKQFYDNGRAFGCYLLKILSNRTASIAGVVELFSIGWLGSWLLFGKRAGRRPMLVAAEFLGVLHSPWAYWKTYRRIPLVTRVS
jgi:glycosyltransferase involved in cell wall biosynthesis